MTSQQVVDRFWSRVEKTEACWLWRGTINAGGYGIFMVGGKRMMAHRVAYAQLKGGLVKGLTLDHLCRTRRCVNPAHLEQVTNRENVLRGVGLTAQNARKTHCQHGHQYTEENTMFVRSGDGHLSRKCRECERAKNRAFHASHADAQNAKRRERHRKSKARELGEL